MKYVYSQGTAAVHANTVKHNVDISDSKMTGEQAIF